MLTLTVAKMTRNTHNAVILVLSTLCLVESKLLLANRKAVKNSELDNIVKTENQLWDDNQSSRTGCMASCLKNEYCKSFAHNSNTGRCQGFSRNYRGQSVPEDVIQQGIMHYDLVDDDCGMQGPISNDCADVQSQGYTCSGLYTIVTGGITKQVWCDLQTDGGRWTVIQRRKDGSVDFDVGWNEYKYGFGIPSQDYWIGNDALYALTSSSAVELLVMLERLNGEWVQARYASFRINDESDKYRLTVPGFSGTACKSHIAYHNGQQFSTTDVDNDARSTACNPDYHTGGWWFKACALSNLNDRYHDSPIITSFSCHWATISNQRESLKTVFMMIRS